MQHPGIRRNGQSMALNEGSCRFRLWHVHVYWSERCIHACRFSREPLPGHVPLEIQRYCAGYVEDLKGVSSIALDPEYPFSAIYRRVREIPYGSNETYGTIAKNLDTSPRVIGLAMKRNPTPLVIPCHRVVSRDGPGGFTPDPEIKIALLAMEQKNARGLSR